MFANLTGHDPVTGAKLVSEDDLPPRRNQPEPTEEELEDDESAEDENLQDETTEETDD